jgi:membrane-bound lytic murein transglycosylase D
MVTIKRLLLLGALGGIQPGFGLTAPGEIPYPTTSPLTDHMAFWIELFTEVGGDEAVIHDAEDLRIVYTKIQLTPNRLRNRRLMDSAQKNIEHLLKSIADKNFNTLTENEMEVLSNIPRPRTVAQISQLRYQVRAQQGLRDLFRKSLERSGRYLGMIRNIFREHGLPAELSYLPHVESAFDVYATSKYGAAGIWQFTHQTGKQYLHISHTVDERRDPEKSTRAAAKLLKNNFNKLQDWALATTAYNHGPAGIQRLIKKHQTRKLEELIRFSGPRFGFASKNFFVSFQAARYVAERAYQYFPDVIPDAPLQSEAVQVPEPLFLYQLLNLHPTLTLSQVIEYNPALRPAVIQNERPLPRGYPLRVPPSEKNLLAKSFPLLPPRTLSVPEPAPPTSPPQKPVIPYVWVQVKNGQSLVGLAREYQTTTLELRRKNQLRGNIKTGDWVLVPYSPSPVTLPSAPQPETTAPPPHLDPPALELTGQPWSILSDVFQAQSDQICLAGRNNHWKDLQLIFLHPYQIPGKEALVAVRVLEGESLEQLAAWAGIKIEVLRYLNGGLQNPSLHMGSRLKIPAEVSTQLMEQRMAFYLDQAQRFFEKHHLTYVQPHTLTEDKTVDALLEEIDPVPAWLLAELNPGIMVFPKLFKGDVMYLPVIESLNPGMWVWDYDDSESQSTF